MTSSAQIPGGNLIFGFAYLKVRAILRMVQFSQYHFAVVYMVLLTVASHHIPGELIEPRLYQTRRHYHLGILQPDDQEYVLLIELNVEHL